jgi:hypothetical protein
MWLARPDLAARWLAEPVTENEQTLVIARATMAAVAGIAPPPARLPDLVALLGGPGAGARRVSVLHQIAAELRAYFGHDEEAMASVEQAAAHRLADVLWIDRCPMLDRLRADARFQQAREVVAARAQAVLAAWDACVVAPG